MHPQTSVAFWLSHTPLETHLIKKNATLELNPVNFRSNPTIYATRTILQQSPTRKKEICCKSLLASMNTLTQTLF